ncbi:16S rRNA (cytosine(1402)-N(4))-methyltransferase RsmH [Thermogutta sp.]|uniref:16S rRNA (cytosine(1402)-N(4))-methyltransferase RsmH n=1 Tax=Thermogutta sp. TaxID=1962930 RepID=UPI00321FBE35
MDVSAETCHIPVMPQEVLKFLDPQPGQIIVDATLGGGGHTRLIAQRVWPGGAVIALDRDPAAVHRAEKNLAALPVRIVQGNFRDLPEILEDLDVETVDGILLDLGMSSDQLADVSRGFSFQADGPLDLRFDPTSGEPAWTLVNRMGEKALADLIYRYGEERFSRRIAARIVEERKKSPIKSARDLAELICRVVPRHRSGGIHPATRTFQALRIAVNDELGALETALRRYPDILRPGGRLVVISFHSLEDRLVKEAFKSDPRYTVLTKKPITPSEEEIAANPRARSAKLRAAART